MCCGLHYQTSLRYTPADEAWGKCKGVAVPCVINIIIIISVIIVKSSSNLSLEPTSTKQSV